MCLLYNVVIIQSKAHLPPDNFCSNLNPLVVLLPKTFKLYGLGRTWWKLFQKCVVCFKLDIYVLITCDNRDFRIYSFLVIAVMFQFYKIAYIFSRH
jgi:hypothetical protein